jgi:hypothetical protein
MLSIVWRQLRWRTWRRWVDTGHLTRGKTGLTGDESLALLGYAMPLERQSGLAYDAHLMEKGERSMIQKEPPSPRGAMPMGNHKEFDLGLAICFGLLAGTALGNVGSGISLGLLSAVTANAYFEKRQNEKGAGTAMAIALGAWVIVGLIWGLTWAGLP